jgi:glycosyltransferase involved in cell wall biosynthesis
MVNPGTDTGSTRTEVLFLSTTDHRSTETGADVRTNNLRDQLRAEFEVTTVTFVDDRVDDEARVVPIDAPSVGVLRLCHPKYFLAVYRELSETDYDVVFVENVFATLYGLLALGLSTATTVFSDHNVSYRVELELGHYGQALVFYAFERCLVSRVDLVVTVSESDRRALSKWTRGEIVVVRNGFDRETYRPSGPARQFERPVVLFFGTMWYEPNVDAVSIIAERIAPAVADRDPVAEFHVVGPGCERIEAIASGTSNLRVVGYVDDLSSYIRGADVVIVPLEDGGGTRLKIIESLACGTPVISTELGAVGWPDSWTSLQVTSLERFPATISDRLETPDGSVPAEVQRYSWDAQGTVLCREIRRRLDVGER